MSDETDKARPPRPRASPTGLLIAGAMTRGLLVSVWATWLGITITAVVLSDLGWARALGFTIATAILMLAPSLGCHAIERSCRRDIARTATALRSVGPGAPRDSQAPQGSEPARDSEPEAQSGHSDRAEGASLTRAAQKLQTRFDEARAAEELARSSRQNARRARGLLFAGVSHDLKGPLNALLGFADLMLIEPLTEGQRESLELIASRGRELVALVETLLDSARVEAGQLGVALREADMVEVLNDARRKAGELVHTDEEVELVFGDRLPRVSVDADHLTRAFALVIAHALKSRSGSSPDFGALTARSNGPRPFGEYSASGHDAVVVRVRNVGDAIRVDVEHRATGPTAAALEELYFTAKRGRGLRLGLRLARTIFELHGGRIEVLEKTNGRPAVACFIRTGPPPRASP